MPSSVTTAVRRGVVLLATPAAAQSGAASGLAGRVADATGAPLASVKITITRPEDGFERATESNNAGDWEARFLAPGAYRIAFEHPGFKTLRRDGVLVSTGQLAILDAVLEVGDLSESVAVTADARMISPGSATIQRTLDRRELEALPTSARNITQMLAIEPGVSADISELLSNDNASISPSVNGARTTNNSLVFNGIDVTNMLCCNSRITAMSGTASGNTMLIPITRMRRGSWRVLAAMGMWATARALPSIPRVARRAT
jgi:hypothetical protein